MAENDEPSDFEEPDQAKLDDRLRTLGEIVIHGCRLEQYSAHILATLLKGSMAETMTVVAAQRSAARRVELVRQVCAVWKPGTFSPAIDDWGAAAQKALTMRNRVIHSTDAVNPDGWFLLTRKPDGVERPEYIYETLDAIRAANTLGNRVLREALEHRQRLDPMQIPEVRDAYWAAVGLGIDDAG